MNEDFESVSKKLVDVCGDLIDTMLKLQRQLTKLWCDEIQKNLEKEKRSK